ARAIRRRELLLWTLRHRRRDARRDALERRAQTDDEPELPHAPAIRVAQRGPAAGVNDAPRRRRVQPRKHLGLDIAEAVHAVAFDRVLVALARPALHLFVDLERARAETRRERGRKGALPD